MASPAWIDNVTPLNSTNMTALQTRDEKGAANGYVPLDGTTKVPLVYLPAGAGLPADTVVVAGTRIIANKLLAGDANNAWRVFGDGKMEWGPGGGAGTDANLYRSTGGKLVVDTMLVKATGANGSTAFATMIALADANFQFQIARDGTMNWGGGGASTPDTNLYRLAAGTLGTDGAFAKVGGALSAPAFGTLAATGSGFWNFYIRRDGQMCWGADSSSQVDTWLWRQAANQLATNGAFYVDYANLSNKLFFGSAADTNLYRSAANVLQTDDVFVVGGNASAPTAPQARNTIEAWLSSMSLITIGETADGDANPAITFYRTVSGFASGSGSRIVKPSSVAGLQFQHAAGAAYGAETYTTYLEIDTSGKLLFGSAADTNLYRSAAGLLRTDGQFGVGGPVYVDMAGAGNKLYWGSAQDTNLYRSAASMLKTDGSLNVAGVLYLGIDTSLYRGAVSTVRTDQQLTAGAGIATLAQSGTTMSDAFFANPQDGLIVVTLGNNKLWMRVNGLWKGVVLT